MDHHHHNTLEQEENSQANPSDSLADAVVAVGLVLVFVAVCIYWISGH